jgi:hypothetical protein
MKLRGEKSSVERTTENIGAPKSYLQGERLSEEYPEKLSDSCSPAQEVHMLFTLSIFESPKLGPVLG